jgi:hypothetical protein
LESEKFRFTLYSATALIISISECCYIQLDVFYLMTSSLEIVGLNSATSGRSCNIHEICGDHLRQGDVCRLLFCNIMIQNVATEAIKVVKVVNGLDACMVGFVPRSFQSMERIYSHVGQLIIIDEIYKESANPYKQRLDKNNRGMASASLVDEDV